MSPRDYLEAARVPPSLQPQSFGLWTIERKRSTPEVDALLKRAGRQPVGFSDYTLLFHYTEATAHKPPGECVMEDSRPELLRHLPIWLAARGRVLITGLGLGCVVRGLLASPDVDHVDVVEIDRDIVRITGAEFAGNPRVTIHCADAMTWLSTQPGHEVWDCAWHDLWTNGDEDGAVHLQVLHGRLIKAFHGRVGQQGAWQFPRIAKNRIPFRLLGAARTRRSA